MNKYAELKAKQQEEFNALPIGFAFGNEQFGKMMKDWGLDPEKDRDKICSIGFNGFVQKKDLEQFRETRKRHNAEMKAAIAADKTGGGFIYQMFLYELKNHEYGYTGDSEDTLDALGYTEEQVQADERLNRGFTKAKAKILGGKGCFFSEDLKKALL